MLKSDVKQIGDLRLKLASNWKAYFFASSGTEDEDK